VGYNNTIVSQSGVLFFGRFHALTISEVRGNSFTLFSLGVRIEGVFSKRALIEFQSVFLDAGLLFDQRTLKDRP
jgi:hypothetical protein